jgi:hypothetical protein
MVASGVNGKHDRFFDKDWSFRKSSRYASEPKRDDSLPEPKAVRLALQARLVIADRERAAWVASNKARWIAEARASVQSGL